MRKIPTTLLLVLAMLGGVAYASIPDDDGVIHGCYKTSDGKLRVIDSATQTCASGETSLTWSQTGPQGPTGATGAAGPAGGQGYAILTEHVDLQPSAAVQGISMGAPIGKVIVSGGFIFDNVSADNPPPKLVFAYVSPDAGPYPGSVYAWGVLCDRAVPCPVDKFIVVVDVAQ